MLDTSRKFLTLVGRDQRGRWALVVALALVVSAVEAGGTLLVFAWLGLMVEAGGGVGQPGVAELQQLLPDAQGPQQVVLAGVVVVVFFLARSAIILLQAYVQFRIAENTGARLAARLVSGYLAMPYTFHLQRDSSSMIRNTFDSVQRFIKDGLLAVVIVISRCAMVLAVMGALFVASPTATLLAAAILGPALWLILRVVQPRVKRLGQTAQKMAHLNLQSLQQSLHGWKDVVLLGREAHFVRAYERDRRRRARAEYLRRTLAAVPRVCLETGVVLFVVAFLAVFATTDMTAPNAVPVLGLFGYAAMRLMPELNVISKYLNSLKYVGPAVDDIHDDLVGFDRQPAPPGTPLPLTREISVERVTFTYPGNRAKALDGVDVVIRAGESVGLVGPTGGGKSTLVDVILGLLPPTEGSVRVDGVDIHTRLRDWHANLGVVSQAIFLTDDTLRRNIALGVPDEAIDEEALEEAVRLAQLEQFIAALPAGLDTWVGERGVRVSGGQRQRLAIARALYRKPQVLVFDEATSALDSETEAAFLDALAQLRGTCTMITVAHRLTTVQSCDRVLLVREGRIVDSGPYPSLVSRQRLATLHREEAVGWPADREPERRP